MRDPSDESESEVLPAIFREELSRLYGQTPRVPAELDAKILAGARSTYVRRSRMRPIMRWVAAGGSLAAAAAVVIVVLVIHHPPTAQVAQAGDVNRDGRVDVLDAYLVAKAIARGEKLDPSWDVNHDGVVDQKDVDWIAATAVNVTGNPTGGSPQ